MTVNQNPPALKHGFYSSLAVLPTEDPAEFEKLHQDLIAKYAPNGAAECQVVRHLSQLIFRQQNLSTFHLAQRARDHARAVRGDRPEQLLAESLVGSDRFEKGRSEQKAADKRARKDLGAAYELIEAGDIATLEGLDRELALHDKLANLIDRALRRLLYLKGLESLVQPTRASPQLRQLEASVASSPTN